MEIGNVSKTQLYALRTSTAEIHQWDCNTARHILAFFRINMSLQTQAWQTGTGMFIIYVQNKDNHRRSKNKINNGNENRLISI